MADAFDDLEQAILDFGQDVLDFANGLITDLTDLANDVIDAIAGAFASSKTEVTSVAVPATYSYTTSLSGGTLTITNSNASELSLAVVSDAAANINYLLVDAPDTTDSVVVAQSKYYTRSFDASGWPWEWGWTSWQLQSTTNIYRTVTFSNMTKFAGQRRVEDHYQRHEQRRNDHRG